MNKKMPITREQFFNFVRKKEETEESFSRSTKHYMNYFDKLQKTGKKYNWNWGGFFLVWFFYRRMYLYGFIVMLFYPLLLVLDDIHFGLEVLENTRLLLGPLFMGICAQYGDYFYFLHASKKISKGKLTTGPSKPALIITLTIFIISIISFVSFRYLIIKS